MDSNITDVGQDKWPFSPEFKKFCEFLGISAERDGKGVNWQHDNRTVNKLKSVYEWGKKRAGNEDIVDIMYSIRQLQRQLGGKWDGLPALNQLYGYSILETKKEELAGKQMQVEKEMSLFNQKEGETDEPYREHPTSA